MARNSFVLYQEQEEVIKKLSDEQAGKLYKAIFEYNRTGETPVLDFMLELIFTPIKQQLDRSTEKYQKALQQRSEAGKRSGESRRNKSNETNERSENRTKRTNVDFVEHNVPVPVPDNDNEPENKIITTTTTTCAQEEILNDDLAEPELRQPYGFYSNVFLFEQEKQDLLSFSASSELLSQVIEELSQNIAEGKVKNLESEHHYAKLRKYIDYRRKYPEKFNKGKEKPPEKIPKVRGEEKYIPPPKINESPLDMTREQAVLFCFNAPMNSIIRKQLIEKWNFNSDEFKKLPERG